MPFATCNDLRLYYEIRGSGPRLLCLNRTGGDLRRAPGIFDMPLARHFEILAYDARGLGQSDRPDKPFTMADYADDARALLDVLGWRPCPVLGVSFGGMVGQELALRYPERVTRLALACTSSGGGGGASYPLHELSALPLAVQADRLIGLLDTRHDAAWAAAHPVEYRAAFARILAALQFGANEPGRMTGARRQLEARALHDTWDRLPGLRMPVYICGGRYDGIATTANLAALHQRIAGSRLELFDSGHSFYVEDPRASGRIGDFLRGKLDQEPS